jgi:hypothetical protein
MISYLKFDIEKKIFRRLEIGYQLMKKHAGLVKMNVSDMCTQIKLIFVPGETIVLV